MLFNKYIDASALLGKTITEIRQTRDRYISIHTSDGKSYRMFHAQECCESVTIHDIQGDLQALVGSPIVKAREKTSDKFPADVERSQWQVEDFTWTTYFFETATAKVRIRWFGESNGYYSETVQIEET